MSTVVSQYHSGKYEDILKYNLNFDYKPISFLDKMTIMDYYKQLLSKLLFSSLNS